MPHAAAFLLSCGAAPRAAGPAFLRGVIQGLPCERRLALPVAAAADSLNRNFFICGPRAALKAAGDARHQSSATHPSVRSVEPAASSCPAASYPDSPPPRQPGRCGPAPALTSPLCTSGPSIDLRLRRQPTTFLQRAPGSAACRHPLHQHLVLARTPPLLAARRRPRLATRAGSPIRHRSDLRRTRHRTGAPTFGWREGRGGLARRSTRLLRPERCVSSVMARRAPARPP